MLEELSISSLGVIEEATVEFGPGLNVVTGETGAGKTLVVTALGLLLGARADTGLVRQGAPRARVEGRLRLESAGAVARRVDDLGAELDEELFCLPAPFRPRAGRGLMPEPSPYRPESCQRSPPTSLSCTDRLTSSSFFNPAGSGLVLTLTATSRRRTSAPPTRQSSTASVLWRPS